MKKIFIIFLTVIFFSGCWSKSSQLTLQNKSGESIASAVVRVCQQELQWKNLTIGAVESRNFAATGDSHYEVFVELSSGKKMSASLGYVTNGMKFQDEILVLPNEIRLVGPTQGK